MAETPLADRIEEVLALRTRHIVAVFEDLYQPHNGAAVIRACECFGVQELHAIANHNAWRVSPEIVAGADAWVDIHTWDQPGGANTKTCLEALKERGYRIWAASLREGCIPLTEVPVDRKIALCFGTELKGLSDEAHDLADGFVRIPMHGFTQSFNISVSTALCLFELTRKLQQSRIPWQLSEADRQELRARWSAGKRARS
ncbi:MAG: RNA methyltransferase [Acidobacteriota bacterium]|nr:RNA methyltransferase [Acidobacteriota bacterium]